MQDRYLFRAKRLDNGQWVQGFICKKKYKSNKFYISCFHDKDDNEQFFAIDPDTICQRTGLKDKNGKLIWENDIVKGKYYDNGKSHRHIGQVKYIYEAYKVVGVKQYTGYHAHLDGSYEVIGNIFDNPELLEEYL